MIHRTLLVSMKLIDVIVLGRFHEAYVVIIKLVLRVLWDLRVALQGYDSVC